MSQTNYTNYKYNPNEINEKDFLEKFVIRNEIYEDIYEDIKNIAATTLLTYIILCF